MLKYIDGYTMNSDEIEDLNELISTVDDPEAIYLWSLVNVMHHDIYGFLRYFEKAIDLGYYPYPAFQIDPLLEPVKSNGDFKKIMEKARKKHVAFKERISI